MSSLVDLLHVEISKSYVCVHAAHSLFNVVVDQLRFDLVKCRSLFLAVFFEVELLLLDCEVGGRVAFLS